MHVYCVSYITVVYRACVGVNKCAWSNLKTLLYTLGVKRTSSVETNPLEECCRTFHLEDLSLLVSMNSIIFISVSKHLILYYIPAY